jgi:hypothetical protein
VNLNDEQGKKLVDESIQLVPEILLIQENNRTVYQRYAQEQLTKRYGPEDYALISGDTISVYISTQALNAQDARTSLNIFVIILVVLFILTFVYGPHFALTISDPVAIMRRGMDDPTYTLEVSIPKLYENDEIYRLADSYNEEFLPMKSRQEMGGGAQSRLADLDFDSLLGDQLDDQESIDSLNEDED